MSAIPITRVDVSEIGPDRYRITLPDGEIIAESPSPETLACAVLHSRGITGLMATYWAARPYPSLFCDIAKLAAIHAIRTAKFRTLREATSSAGLPSWAE